MKPMVSVVIRAFNEAESLRQLLQILRQQIYPTQEAIELIVVDNESTDETAFVAKEFGATVVTLPRQEFTYPRSMNVGTAAATSPIVVLTVAHALPMSNTWLEAALRHFKDESIAGVYAPPIPHQEHSLAESFLYMPDYWRARITGIKRIRKIGTGVFGATNVAFRKSLWEKHPFDEQYELGGEDTHWAKWAFSEGYHLIRDPAFTVRHSHHLRWIGVMNQLRYWRKLRRATTFSREALRFRNDIKW